MPTHHERLFHGIGAGDDLGVVDTPAGRIGGLICWENRMPLARAAVYRGGPQIWVAPTADTSDGWQATMRHIAIESGAFVVAAPQFIPASAFPDDFPLPLPEGKEVFGRGGAVIVEPSEGDVIAGPLYGEEGIVIADCDLRVGLHAKRLFDAAGHYGREDTLLPLLASTSWRAPAWRRSLRAHFGDQASGVRVGDLDSSRPRRELAEIRDSLAEGCGGCKATGSVPRRKQGLLRVRGDLHRNVSSAAGSVQTRLRAASIKSPGSPGLFAWAILDSNQGPPPYQSGALTN